MTKVSLIVGVKPQQKEDVGERVATKVGKVVVSELLLEVVVNGKCKWNNGGVSDNGGVGCVVILRVGEKLSRSRDWLWDCC